MRDNIKELSGSEILNLLLNELDLRRIIATWGNMQQRFDNIDVMRKMASEYEERCNRLQTAASLGGLLLWLTEIENDKNDKQASGENEEAVNILTYHRSKGLEYPILVCHSLEQTLRADLWGTSIQNEGKAFDINKVLAGRWLRYWVNPYADQYRRTLLEERLEKSPAYEQKRQQALAEEARLLYVGITRARDYLIFTSRDKPTKWLNRVWHEGKEDNVTLQIDGDSPWEWNDQPVPIQPRTFVREKDFESNSDFTSDTVHYIQPTAGQVQFEKYKIDLREENWEDRIQSRTTRTINYAPALDCPDEDEKYDLGKAFKAFLIADHTEYDLERRRKNAQAHINRFELSEDLKAEDFVKQADAFRQFIQPEQFPIQHRKYVIYLHHEKRLFDTALDFLFVNDKRVLLVQNSGFAGDAKRYQKHAKEALGSWSYLSKQALEELFSGRHVEVWAHFVLGGVLMQLETDWKEK